MLQNIQPIIDGAQYCEFLTHTPNDQPQDALLLALEELKDVPFTIKRIYYVYHLHAHDNRGMHAHKVLQQLLICMYGSCDIVIDNGKQNTTVSLTRPNEGLLLTSPIWRELKNFSENSVFMCLASHLYDPNDYIWTYKDFLQFIQHTS